MAFGILEMSQEGGQEGVLDSDPIVLYLTTEEMVEVVRNRCLFLW